MPGIEDWVTNPLEIISTLFDENPEAYAAKVREYFSARTKDSASLLRVASLNDTPLHNLCTNSLVRFRCMVQDMYDPEFYLGLYEVEDLKTGQCHLRSGMFRDFAECTPHQDIKLESPRNVTMDRQTLYSLPSTSSVSLRTKRSLEDEDTVVPSGGAKATTSNGDSVANGDVLMTADPDKQTDTKRSRTHTQQGRSDSVTPDLNFPLPGETGPACIMKIYDNTDRFKVNDVVEFIGVLSNDPATATFPEKKQNDTVVTAADLMEGIEEQDARSPPSSLVPRIHVILTRDCLHSNPLVPDSESHNSALQRLQEEVCGLREQLTAVLEQAVFGDRLTAEYLLLSPHLINVKHWSIEEFLYNYKVALPGSRRAFQGKVEDLTTEATAYGQEDLTTEATAYGQEDLTTEATAYGQEDLTTEATAYGQEETKLVMILVRHVHIVLLHRYSRQDVVAVGKFSLNLMGFPCPSNFPQRLYSLLESLVTKSFYLPMTLENMNKLRFSPKKDYNANRLSSGLLQLSENTHLVLDETALQPGQLDSNGVQNITALGNLITWQKVEYDFDFHKQDFPCNILALVLSEGKSILKCDCQVRVIPRLSTSPDEVEKRYEGILTFLTPALLARLRTYLSAVRQLPYRLSTELQKEIEEDFVDTRREDSKRMTVEDFHCLLVLARLLCLSHGKSEPTKGILGNSEVDGGGTQAANGPTVIASKLRLTSLGGGSVRRGKVRE
ncbi:Mini-chromosome maintenance complex-binding protein [Lamellibrachia satsuma]|nr:Mini-chromosome maintenance complex-binding protein [Lamellibrachia satsuma]